MKFNKLNISSKITIFILIIRVMIFNCCVNLFAESFYYKSDNLKESYSYEDSQQQVGNHQNHQQSSNFSTQQSYPSYPPYPNYPTNTIPAEPNMADFHALVFMLGLIESDLQMCEHSIRASNNYINTVLTIGYIKNSKSALSKANIHPAYNSLLREIDERLSRIKFHIVMNDKMNSLMMISQLRSIIRNIIVSYSAANSGYSAYSYSKPNYYNPQNNTNYNYNPNYYPILPPITINFSNGQNFTPPTSNMPTNLIPTSDSY